MDKEAQQILAFSVLFLAVCFGFAKCQKNSVEVQILQQQVEVKK